MATIKRTGGSDFPDKLKALVTGPPKSGKTTLLGTIPNIIIADTEPKANNLASLAHLDVPYVTIESSADLRELLMVLGNDSLRAAAAAEAGMPSIDAVAIDTLDTLQKILKRERMHEQRSTKFVRDDWAWMKEEMTKIVEAFTALPLHVVFTVHIATKNVGTEQNPQTMFQPGLEGAIANEIPGMVGYSLRSFRKEEFDQSTGQRYTKYWLQAEGDETYDFLGTRTAGRLPALIEPDFGTIYKAAMAGCPVVTTPATPVALPTAPPQQAAPVQQPPQQQAPQAPAPQAPAQAPAPQQEAAPAPQAPAPAPESGPNAGPAQQAQQAAPAPQQQAPQGGQAPLAPDTDPVNEPALQALSRIYEACGLPFPEQQLRQLTLGDARTTVKMWKAIQADAAEGKLQEGDTAVSTMVDYLTAMKMIATEAPTPAQEKAIEPKLGGTIPEAKAYVESAPESEQLARANEAFEYERSNGNRTTLMTWLESKGARHGGGAPQQPAQEVPGGAPAPAPQVQTPVQNPAPEQAAPAVTQEAPSADASSTEEAAVKAVEEGLNGAVISEEVNPDAACGECGKPLDDPDIAKLALTRFKKPLCVDDYIAATRA